MDRRSRALLETEKKSIVDMIAEFRVRNSEAVDCLQGNIPQIGEIQRRARPVVGVFFSLSWGRCHTIADINAHRISKAGPVK